MNIGDRASWKPYLRLPSAAKLLIGEVLLTTIILRTFTT